MSVLAALTVLLAGAALAVPAPAHAGTLGGIRPTAAGQPAVTAPAHGQGHRRTCAEALPNHATCFAELLDGVATPMLSSAREPAGYSPTDLQSAYSLPATAGAGATVAIVDAYDLPAAESGLSTYRSAYGLPPCASATGCFRKVNQTGDSGPLPKADAGWGTEIALDIEMVSAACPLCKILLVEADSSDLSNLGAAVDTAVRLGAKYVSNSYGTSATADFSTLDDYYNHPGVVITAASGDSAYGSHYPASSPFVTAVGGTSLTRDTTTTRGWSETAWSEAGSGCSGYGQKPVWQTDAGCSTRTITDVSAVADVNTGVAVFDPTTSTWGVAGGTSVSAPLIAAIYALAGSPVANTYPSSYPYAHSAQLNDVTSGSNGSCTPAYLCNAGPGLDGPTGLGTPNGVAAFTGGTRPAVIRVAGSDKYGTSAAVSRSSFAPGVAVAYVASGNGYVDALSGGPAAGFTNGPVLLVGQTAVPAIIQAELQRLKPQRIVILGGDAVVSASVEQQLRTFTAGSVTRLAGADRFATSAAISTTFPAGVSVAYVATGRNFPDALSGAALAASSAAGGPMLLVESDSIPPLIKAELTRLRPGRIVILGGSAVISDSVQQQLAGFTAGAVSRLSGTDRYGTSAAISAQFPAGTGTVYVATGTNFPDALTGAPAAGLQGAPVLLVDPNSIPAPVVAELTRLNPVRIIILGGLAAVSASVAAAL